MSNYKDVIVFCPDTVALVAELRDKHPDRLGEMDPENPIFIVDKTPTVRNGLETIALVRADSKTLSVLESMASVQVLGTYEEIAADPDAQAIYARVYPRKPVTWKDENDKKRTTTPPEKIGVFA